MSTDARGARRACIVGIGTSDKFGLTLDEIPIRLQVQAYRAALADAGLSKAQVDGFVTAHGGVHGVDYEDFVVHTGSELRWVLQLWTHGRWASTAVIQAMLAVSAGLADVVAICNTTTHARGYGRHLKGLGESQLREPFRDIGGGHGESGPYGIDTPGAATAFVAQRYMDLYGATSEDLGRIALGYRAHANRNPMAIMTERSLSMEEYLDASPIVGPLRKFDYCLRSEGATCLLVTTEERARDMRQKPVAVAGWQALRASRDDFLLFGRPGLSLGFEPDEELSPAPQAVYETAGVSPMEVDGLYVYDSFTSNLWVVLERFGFCKPGEAFHLVREGGIGLDGRVPVNTNGGLHSEAHLSGYAHLVEMVRQLRGEAGARQLPRAGVLQWATPWGDSIILTPA